MSGSNVLAANISQRLAFLIEYLDLAEATGDPDAQWEFFQVQHLNNDSLLAIDRKARQVGWSWTCAAEAVGEGVLVPRSTSIFVSISQDEAKEKVRYAKQIIEALDEDVRPRLIHDNETYIELENGSRLISHPCRPARGKARANVYLDEFAHYPKDREIYLAALPVTTHGGRLRIGSSPLGAGGMFWEISEQSMRQYPGYTRRRIAWWEVASLCNDVNRARIEAEAMMTEERSAKFMKPRLNEIFENMLLEDFQQEYEGAWVDESVAWITWDEIKKNQLLAQEDKLWCRQARSVEEAMRVIDEVMEATQRGEIESVLAGGMDVGRHRNLSEIVLIGKGTTAEMPYRLGISLSNVEFDDQRAIIDKIMECLPVVQFLIDRNGLGNQLAEQVNKRFGDRAQGVDFTNPSKELWSVEYKLQMQRGNSPIPLDRELSYQIHSIKKMVTAAKNNVFDTKRNQKHHADKYWAHVLAVWAARGADVPQSFVMSYR